MLPNGPKSLEGYVRDAKLIARFLAQASVPASNIRMLTVTVQPGSDDPLETSDRWPTRSNIK